MRLVRGTRAEQVGSLGSSFMGSEGPLLDSRIRSVLPGWMQRMRAGPRGLMPFQLRRFHPHVRFASVHRKWDHPRSGLPLTWVTGLFVLLVFCKGIRLTRTSAIPVGKYEKARDARGAHHLTRLGFLLVCRACSVFSGAESQLIFSSNKRNLADNLFASTCLNTCLF